MKKYKITITADAEDSNQASKIADAYNTINRYLPKDDLVHIASEIKKDPGVIAKIRKISQNPLVLGLFKK